MSDAVVDALKLGKAMEREAIVAWLRKRAESKVGADECSYAKEYTVEWDLADFIESGEHLRGNNE